MRNIWRVLKRDILRLLKAPAALVVVLVLIVLPSLYTWFNVAGFWNPYDNTGNLRICVVNQDEGASSELTGDLRLGDEIVDELHGNTQLGWTFTDYDTAMREVESGEAYAAFVIPSDFSYCFTTLLSGDVQQPALGYYVNEKAGAVSPKVTDTGATSLEQTINSTFVSVASGIVADRLQQDLDDARAEIGSAQDSAAGKIGEAKAHVGEARVSLENLGSAGSAAKGKSQEAVSALQEARSTVEALQDQISRISDDTVTVQNELGPLSTRILSSLERGSLSASQGVSKAHVELSGVASTIEGASGTVKSALAQGQRALDEYNRIIARLEQVKAALPADRQGDFDAVLSKVKDNRDKLQSALDALKTADTDVEAFASGIVQAGDDADSAVQQSLSRADAYRSAVSDTALPAVNDALSRTVSLAADLSTAASTQKMLIDQAITACNQLSMTLDGLSGALDQTDSLMANVEQGLGSTQSDLAALGTSDLLSQIAGGKIDSGTVADFMLSPTKITTIPVYAPNSYGAAMAPLFFNLTLWIGVFMLMVILLQEVDDEGIPGLTLGQRYWGRYLFLAPIAALQAVVCCIGCLVLGMLPASVPLFFVTAVVASLTYLTIQFTLSVSLQHIGKGLCVVLVFVQIPGATGLYPVEMMPEFFRNVYPFFPFTYGINALRETIGGFYQDAWLSMMGMLVLFGVIFLILGLALRPYLTNLNRMFASQIRESDIFNGEEVHAPARRYRWEQLMDALSDREEYREGMRVSAARFLHVYPRLKACAWAFGIGVPALTTVVLTLNEGEKVVLLTVWLIWLVLMITFLVVVEFVRDSVQHRLGLADMSDEELRGLFRVRSQKIGPNVEPGDGPAGGDSGA